MPKEQYDISYKTYFNSRLKPVPFRGEEIFPIYVRMTFLRETIFFKSYYFDLFTRPKYEFLKMSIPRVEKIEMETIGRIIDRQTDHFDLNLFLREYRSLTPCLLDAFDEPFRRWLSSWLRNEGLPGLSNLADEGNAEIAAIRLWDDLEKCLAPAFLEKLREAAIANAPAYIPLVTYVRHLSANRPFCLPHLDWSQELTRNSIEDFFDETFGYMRVDFDKLLRDVRNILRRPPGILP